MVAMVSCFKWQASLHSLTWSALQKLLTVSVYHLSRGRSFLTFIFNRRPSIIIRLLITKSYPKVRTFLMLWVVIRINVNVRLPQSNKLYSVGVITLSQHLELKIYGVKVKSACNDLHEPEILKIYFDVTGMKEHTLKKRWGNKKRI